MTTVYDTSCSHDYQRSTLVRDYSDSGEKIFVRERSHPDTGHRWCYVWHMNGAEQSIGTKRSQKIDRTLPWELDEALKQKIAS